MQFDRISVQELKEMLAGSSPPAVVDVRAPQHYAAGHIPGAKHAPTGHGADAAAGVPRDQLVLTYCDKKQRAKASQEYRCERVAGKAAAQGYRVAVLDGGFPAWRRAGLPVERAPV